MTVPLPKHQGRSTAPPFARAFNSRACKWNCIFSSNTSFNGASLLQAHSPCAFECRITISLSLLITRSAKVDRKLFFAILPKSKIQVTASSPSMSGSTSIRHFSKTPILRPFPSLTPRKDTYVQRGQRTSALHRGWRLLRAELRGALLVFHLPGDMRTAGVDGISNMYDAALLRHGFARAVHHNKRPHVFELVLMNGREMLVQARLVPVSNAFLYSATNYSSSRHVMSCHVGFSW